MQLSNTWKHTCKQLDKPNHVYVYYVYYHDNRDNNIQAMLKKKIEMS